MHMRWVIGAAVAAVTGGTAVVVLGLLQRKPADWWAAWGQWIGGAGSIAAAVVALWIAQAGWRRAAEDAHRSEASAFSVWLEWSTGDDEPEVRYFNGGPAPVYDAHVMIQVSPRQSLVFGPYTFGPAGRPRCEAMMTKMVREAIGREVDWRVRHAEVDDEESLRVAVESRLDFAYRSGGQVWRRTAGGRLVAEGPDADLWTVLTGKTEPYPRRERDQPAGQSG